MVLTNEESIQRINEITIFPDYYQSYNRKIIKSLLDQYSLAINARQRNLDPTNRVESEIAFDLGDRIERMFNIPLSNRLKELLIKYERTESAALHLAEEVALGKFGYLEKNDSLDKSIRIGLAVVTDGITVAPLQGISSIKIKNNEDGSNYVSVSFAGPIRSAGGTEAAFTIVIADHIRKVLGLDSYHVNSWGDEEIGRFIEELRIYEREVSNFQFRVSDEDIKYTLSNLPVEIDGVETDPVEVIVHRGLKRIETDRVRGGALRVLNDGIIGRSRKLLSLLNQLSIPNWDWLKNLESGNTQDSLETRVESSHFQEVISGRAVISMSHMVGSFRLRYGRSYNTGLSTIGLNPILAIILEYPFVVGTQVKLNMPGKAAVVAFVDSIEPPIVRLKDGSVIKVDSIELAKSIVNQIDKILHLGDILISYGDFLENNVKLPKSGYVEEWWSQDLQKKITEKYGTIERFSSNTTISIDTINKIIEEPFDYYPTLSQSITIAKKCEIPLHPKYVYYWDNLSISEVILLIQKLVIQNLDDKRIIKTPSDIIIKNILERAGIPHICYDDSYIITEESSDIIITNLGLNNNKSSNIINCNNIEELMFTLSGLIIRSKSSVNVGLRVGRPEKAMIRKMKSPINVLFPIGNISGSKRDIIKAIKNDSIDIELINTICSICGEYSSRNICSKCGGLANIIKTCPICKKEVNDICPICKQSGIPYKTISYPIRIALNEAIDKIHYKPNQMKGVKSLTNRTRIPELLEKGIIRTKHNLFVYKDGTTRFDATNTSLTNFTPRQINISLDKLMELGYLKDIKGADLKDQDQILELYVQDIILPYSAAEYLFSVSNFVDELLIKLYKMEPFYKLTKKEDIVGHLVIGLAPHTSVGIIGRVIGFTNAQVCFAHPYWHSAKRRDCDGDEDAILLLLDILLNFSREYIPEQIGGLMDTPLLIQPIIIPKELQRQAQNLDVSNRYPLEFYESTMKDSYPNKLFNYIDIIRNRLDSETQFNRFYFTHPTKIITIEEERSSYSTLETLQDKLNKQIEIAIKIEAVDPIQVVSSVLNTHLLPDIIGNMKSYTSQKFRCKKCGEKYRRFPLKAVCLSCGGDLQLNVTRGSVEKYLQLSIDLSEKYGLDEYLCNRLKLISEEFDSLFIKNNKKYLELTNFL